MPSNSVYDEIVSNKKVKIVNSDALKLRLSALDAETAENAAVTGTAYLYSAECVKKEVKYTGKAVFSIVYEKDKELNQTEAALEFSFKFPVDKDLKKDVFGSLKLSDVKIVSGGGMVDVVATVTFEGVGITETRRTVFAGNDDYILKKETIDYLKRADSVKKSFAVEDELELQYAIGGIMAHGETAYVTSVAAGVGAVILDGEAEVSLVTKGLNEAVYKEEKKVIPFRAEVADDAVNPSDLASATVIVTDRKLKALVDEAKGTTSITIELTLEANAERYEQKSVDLISDAFSKSHEIILAKESDEFLIPEKFISGEEKISGEIAIDGDKNGRLIFVSGASLDEAEVAGADGAVEISGVVIASAVAAKETGEYFAVNESLPFGFKVKTAADGFLGLKLTVTAFNLRLIGGILAYDFVVKYSFTGVTHKKAEYVVKADEGEARKISDAAISVYLPEKGDTLWSVAKTLGMSEDEVLKTNGELNFPLSGDERIIIYREIR